MGNELWAWQVEEQPDVWSMIGAMVGGMHTPLFARNHATVMRMEPIARAHAKAAGQPLRLAHFTLTEVVTT